MIKSCEELIVWQKGMILAERAYEIVRILPKEELFALGAQMRRAAISIPSNIAEGFGRGTRAEFAHFLVIARGSLYELNTQVELAQRFGYVTETNEYKQISLEVSRLIHTWIQKLQTQPEITTC